MMGLCWPFARLHQQGHVHLASPHPAAFAIGGVVRYCTAIGVIDPWEGTEDNGLASLRVGNPAGSPQAP
jgi:hypothetical protein